MYYNIDSKKQKKKENKFRFIDFLEEKQFSKYMFIVKFLDFPDKIQNKR